MKSRSDRPGRDAERLGDLVERHVEVVVQDHHRTVFDGEPPEAALELVAIDDRAQAIRRHRLIGREEAHVRGPATGSAALGVAGAHEEPIRPGVKARRVAELRKVSPDVEQRLLRGVLGEVGVAQDPVRHRMEPIADGHGEAGEGPFVAALRSNHEFGIHAPSACGGPIQIGALIRYGPGSRRATQSSREMPDDARALGDARMCWRDSRMTRGAPPGADVGCLTGQS